MRIISGSKRGMNLVTPEGMSTRPTSDRIKETLFNMIAPDIYDSYFLDLFSGSGQMGIEALSRGAKEAIFVEKDKKAIVAIESNLKKTGFDESSILYKNDVFFILSQLRGHEPFDIIFMDPPYNHLIEKQVLEQLYRYDYVSEDTLVIVEASLETSFEYVSEIGFSIIKEKLYKTNKHLFLKKA